MAPGPVLQGFSFFPRGGSAQVVRYLTAALLQAGWTPRIVAGSVGDTWKSEQCHNILRRTSGVDGRL